MLWSIALTITNFLSALFFIATNIGERRRTILAVWEQNWKTYKEHFKNLPPLTKILFSLSIVLIIAFISSVWYISAQKTKSTAEQKFTDQLKTLKEKKDSAESYLIYNDEAKASSEIMEAKNILAGADCLTDTHQSACSELQKQIDALALRVKKETIITPELIYDWSNITISLTGLAKINNKIIAFSKENPDLYVYDLLTKTSKTITTDVNTSGFTAKAVPKENDYAIFVYNKNKLLQYNPVDDTMKTIEITYPNDNTNITGLVIYNRKLYTIDAGNNQIYKHDNIKSGFGAGRIWIKDGSKISNPIDITIDGDVFVAENSGAISKFNAGKKEGFDISIIDPRLTQINNLWTYNDLQYLYILDTTQNRLVILKKDGQLYKQLTSKTFLAPTGMAIEETDRIGYVLDGNKLYKIGL